MVQGKGVFGPASRQIGETVTVYLDKKIQFRDTGLYIQSSADGKLKFSSDGSGADDFIFSGNATFENDITVQGDFTFGNAATDNLTVNGDLIIADDQKLHLGTGEDFSIEFDEDGTDDVRITTASALGVGLIGTMGSGTATGSGGVITLTAGAGGATSGAGGAVLITAGAGTNGNAVGGASELIAGAGQGSAAGGQGSLTGGAGGATGAGGAISIDSGGGGSTSGVSGEVTVSSGTVANATTGTASATGGVTITTGAAGTATTGTAGASGTIAITGVVGGASSGAGGTGGAGGSVTITAGAGGADSEGASGTGGAGGDLILTAGAGGTGNTAGQDGQIIMRSGGTLPVLREQVDPPTATDTATLTAAQMLGGILVGTPTAAAAYTTLTGTQIEAALSGNVATNDSFDLSIINLGGAGDIITLTAGSGVSIVGSATIDDPGADINSSGLFRFRRSAANTFVAYRIA